MSRKKQDKKEIETERAMDFDKEFSSKLFNGCYLVRNDPLLKCCNNSTLCENRILWNFFIKQMKIKNNLTKFTIFE